MSVEKNTRDINKMVLTAFVAFGAMILYKALKDLVGIYYSIDRFKVDYFGDFAAFYFSFAYGAIFLFTYHRHKKIMKYFKFYSIILLIVGALSALTLGLKVHELNEKCAKNLDSIHCPTSG